MPNETLHAELHEAKIHAKEAARATLLAIRSALDFALNKLEDHAPAPKPASAEYESAPPSGQPVDNGG